MLRASVLVRSRGAVQAARFACCAWALVGCAGGWSARTATGVTADGALTLRVEVVPGGLNHAAEGTVDTDVLLVALDGAGRQVWARQFGTDGPDVPVSVDAAPDGGVRLTYRAGAFTLRALLDRDGALVAHPDHR